MFLAGRDADARDYFERGMRAPKSRAFQLIDPAPFLNSFAWFLATCPNKSFRNGASAINLAERVCRITHWRNSYYVDTLAAAKAESGDFSSAIKYEEQAIALEKGATKRLTKAEERLRKFQRHEPFHERLKTSDSDSDVKKAD